VRGDFVYESGINSRLTTINHRRPRVMILGRSNLRQLVSGPGRACRVSIDPRSGLFGVGDVIFTVKVVTRFCGRFAVVNHVDMVAHDGQFCCPTGCSSVTGAATATNFGSSGCGPRCGSNPALDTAPRRPV